MGSNYKKCIIILYQKENFLFFLGEVSNFSTESSSSSEENEFNDRLKPLTSFSLLKGF
jgi:hypothetical protein